MIEKDRKTYLIVNLREFPTMLDSHYQKGIFDIFSQMSSFSIYHLRDQIEDVEYFEYVKISYVLIFLTFFRDIVTSWARKQEGSSKKNLLPPVLWLFLSSYPNEKSTEWIEETLEGMN